MKKKYLGRSRLPIQGLLLHGHGHGIKTMAGSPPWLVLAPKRTGAAKQRNFQKNCVIWRHHVRQDEPVGGGEPAMGAIMHRYNHRLKRKELHAHGVLD
jgi:hypothetical protein